MSLRLIFNFIAISGFFSKRHDELEISPPPPPFQKIEKEEIEAKETKSEKKNEKRRKGEKLEKKRREEERRREDKERKMNGRGKKKEKEKKLEKKKEAEKERPVTLVLKRKQELKTKKNSLVQGGVKTSKKKIFDFFQDTGSVRTEPEKNERKKQKEKDLEKKKQEENSKKREFKKGERKVKKEKPAEKNKLNNEKSQTFSEIDGIEDLQEQKQGKKNIFGNIFFKKKVNLNYDEELEALEKLKLPVKEEVKDTKFKVPEFNLPEGKFENEVDNNEKITKPKEIAQTEDEIQKAISGMKKVKKRSFIPESLFKKKENPVAQKIEIPEVMPKTYDKIDYVEEIERKMHKARLALMDFKFDDAKRIYVEIMGMYKELESKKKRKVYQDIKDLYYERKSAEKIAKK